MSVNVRFALCCFGLIVVFVRCTPNPKFHPTLNQESLVLDNEFFHEDGDIVRGGVLDSEIYVLNSRPLAVTYIYSLDGRLVDKIGRPGPAPWENSSIWFFSFHEDMQSYWVFDYPKKLLRRHLLSNDSLLQSNEIPFKSNMLYLRHSQFIVANIDPFSKNYNISKYDFNEDSIVWSVDLNRILGITSNPEEKGLTYYYFLECEFSVIDSTSFLCSFNRYPKHLIINLKSDSVIVVDDFRSLKEPESSIENQIIRMKPNYDRISLGSDVENEFFYIITNSNPYERWAEADSYFIDIYDLRKDVKYLFSRRIDKMKKGDAPIGLKVRGDKLYLFTRHGGIYQYSITHSNLHEKLN